MPLDNPQYVGNLDSSNPKGTDSKTIADDSIRNFKEGVRMSFPNVKGEVISTHQDLNLVSGMQASSTKPLPGISGQSVYYLYNNTAPPGTTIEATDGNIRALMIGAQAQGGTIGGTQDPTSLFDTVNITISVSGDTGNHTLTRNELPDLPYSVTGINPCGAGNVSGPNVGSCVGAMNTNAHAKTIDNGGQGHNHSFSDSGSDSDSVNFTPRYARGILVKLDA